MNLEFKHLLPDHFPPHSKVWIYQSNRLLRLSEALEAEELIAQFCVDWRTHGAKVEAYGNLFFGQFLILMADESSAGVSGCSTDSSVRFVKELGQKFSVDFFDRTNLAFVVKDKVELLPLSQATYAFQNNFITEDTLYFNNTITNKDGLENKWIIPVKESWLAKKLGVTQHAS
ncbi:MAG TPA: hypothetical protein VM935_04840 [Chitinophagaceae bacterium]|jgi:hypothetical protein|nr:hypothetical protein [Chitinophagaceae bacterium]